MIHHADAALTSWLRAGLAALDVSADVAVGTPGDPADLTSGGAGSRKKAKPTVRVELIRIDEQRDRRDNEVDDVRDASGRVTARQRSARFFELDYRCVADGEPADAHRILGGLLQIAVGADAIPDEHVPDELAAIGAPIDVAIAPAADDAGDRSPSVGAGIVLRLVIPVRPTADTVVGPPAEILHLDVGPAPVNGRRVVDADGNAAADGADAADADGSKGGGIDPRERRWTTVRRREFIAPPTAAADTTRAER